MSRFLAPVFAFAILAPAAALAQNAATVNGQAIPESAVERGLKLVPKEAWDKARVDILNFLIANAIIDQHLATLKIEVPAADVDKRLADFDVELKKRNKDRAALLKELNVTEEEFKDQVVKDLRWEKFADSRATDAALKELFEGNKETFDGSQVRARHILLTPANDATKAELTKLKKQITTAAAEAIAKLPMDAKPEDRSKATEDVFAAVAKDKSTCPSKRDGGDLGLFSRVGTMVEPFAKAAFALKLHEISDPVQTQFGYHLIMPTERKTGQQVKFEDIKDAVKELYCLRLRESLVAELKPKARIVIAPK